MERRDDIFDWQLDEKIKLVLTDYEERVIGRGFMKRVKQRWDEECPQKASVLKQNLTDNTKRFQNDPEMVNTLHIMEVSNNEAGKSQAGDQLTF